MGRQKGVSKLLIPAVGRQMYNKISDGLAQHTARRNVGIFLANGIIS